MKHIKSKIQKLYTNVQEVVDKKDDRTHNELSEEKPWDGSVKGVEPEYKMSSNAFSKMMHNIVSALSDRELKQLRSELQKYGRSNQ